MRSQLRLTVLSVVAVLGLVQSADAQMMAPAVYGPN
jgi:hypothetical protein